MAKKRNPRRSARSNQKATVQYISSDEKSSDHSSSERENMASNRTRSKRHAKTNASNVESDSSHNQPIGVARSASDTSDQIPNDEASDPLGGVATPMDEPMPEQFSCDVVVNVTRLSRNMDRVLAKHKLGAIYDSSTKKVIVKRHNAKPKKVILGALPK